MLIVPKPQKIEIKEGKLSTCGFKIVADDEKIYKFAELKEGSTEVCFKKGESEICESYTLIVSENGIDILYADIEGAFRAFTTLKQILRSSEDGKIEFCRIEDYPSIKNRGYMLGTSRRPKVEYLKWLIDILADLKFNQLQLYMDSFEFEHKNFPEFWKDTEPYSKKDMEEIIEYCKERFIDVVPTVNGFGHMGAWLQKEELAHLAITREDGKPSTTLNPLLDESLELVNKIYDGFLDIFPVGVVNIGMDEPFELGMSETREICEKKGKGRVYTEHLNKICKIVSEKYNKTPMFWDDVIFAHPEELENLPKDCIVMEWGYETEHYFDRYCASMNEKGLRYYVCPGSSTWRTFCGRTNNMMFNIVSAAKSAAFYGAEGILTTEWGDPGYTHTPSVTYLPLVFAGAMSWNAGNMIDIPACMERREVIADCKKYLDKVIFKSSGEASLADIAYRMGNYYFLEDSVNCNATELSCCFTRPEVITEEMKPGFKRVIKYLKGIREELEEVRADEISLREITLNCDMAIFTAELVLGKRDRAEADRIINEHRALWGVKHKMYNSGNYAELVNVFFDEN